MLLARLGVFEVGERSEVGALESLTLRKVNEKDVREGILFHLSALALFDDDESGDEWFGNGAEVGIVLEGEGIAGLEEVAVVRRVITEGD